MCVDFIKVDIRKIDDYGRISEKTDAALIRVRDIVGVIERGGETKITLWHEGLRNQYEVHVEQNVEDILRLIEKSKS